MTARFAPSLCALRRRCASAHTPRAQAAHKALRRRRSEPVRWPQVRLRGYKQGYKLAELQALHQEGTLKDVPGLLLPHLLAAMTNPSHDAGAGAACTDAWAPAALAPLRRLLLSHAAASSDSHAAMWKLSAPRGRSGSLRKAPPRAALVRNMRSGRATDRRNELGFDVSACVTGDRCFARVRTGLCSAAQ